MKHYTHVIRYAMVGLALCGALLLGTTIKRAVAQDQSGTKTSRGERDPFRKPEPPKRPSYTRANPMPLTPPSIQDRVNRYRAQKMAAMEAQRPAPKPTTALLLSEMQVTGIFRTPRGYAAMVEATPIKLSYVIYPGETFFDGQLVAIEENRLVFRRVVLWSDGRRELTVEMKPLRQPNAVNDGLTVPRSASSAPVEADKNVAAKAPDAGAPAGEDQ